MAVADSLTRREDSDNSSNGDRGNHDSVHASQSQNQACAQNPKDDNAPIFVGGSEEVSDDETIRNELDFDETDEHDFVTRAGNAFAKASAESEASGTEVQDSDAEFGANNLENGMRHSHNLLKRKQKTGGQGSKDNPLVICDESESGSESGDDLVWKKRRVNQVPWLRTADETDDEIDNFKPGVSCTRARARSESDGIACQIEDFASTTTDIVEPQPVARVGCNGEWRIHGIIGKEVIDGVLHYCVDWEPTMLPENDLRGAWCMVQEFEAKEQARGKGGDSRKRKQVGRGKQQF
ncbi:MAG: hypothetical protein M1840_007203 [Geoglossum simile]|nr:MAG: hypothetical protein M1840_007203 [Geoglossum simile]